MRFFSNIRCDFRLMGSILPSWIFLIVVHHDPLLFAEAQPTTTECVNIWIPLASVPIDTDCMIDGGGTESSGWIAMDDSGTRIFASCGNQRHFVYDYDDDDDNETSGSSAAPTWIRRGSPIDTSLTDFEGNFVIGGFSPIAMSGDGTVVAIAGEPIVYVWDGNAGGGGGDDDDGDWVPLGAPLDVPDFSVSNIALSQDGRSLALLLPGAEVRVLDYNTNTNSWEIRGEAIPIDDEDGTMNTQFVFGSDLALSPDGTTVARSLREPGPLDDNRLNLVQVYRFVSDAWSQLGDTLFTPNTNTDSIFADSFGASIALSEDGNTLVVGAPTANGPGEDDDSIGEVTVYTFDDSSSPSPTWNQVGEAIQGAGSICDRPDGPFAPTNGFCSDTTGSSVDVSNHGSRIAIGTRDARGYLRVFENPNNVNPDDHQQQWVQVGGDKFTGDEGSIPQDAVISGTDGTILAWGVGGLPIPVYRLECVPGGVPSPTQAPYEEPPPRCTLGPICPVLDVAGALAAFLVFCTL